MLHTGHPGLTMVLAVLRAAKKRQAQELAAARQGLRRLVTVRQEAELVLSGLLD